MALEDLTVIDIATLGAAPQIATFFADLGARVIKVEHPRGDGLRQLVDDTGVALQWQIINRNKECITLDINRPEGRTALDRLLESADLLVSNLNAERLARWQLEPALLARRHPRLVAVNLTAYGLSGPWADRPGSGTLAEAVSGLAALTGEPDGPPGLAPVGLGDYLGVLQGIIVALVGLHERSGAAFFDLSMHRPLLALLSHRIATAARDGVEPGRHGNRFPNVAPRNTYRAADGAWVALTAGTDELTRRLFEVIGRPELTRDPRFADNLARVENVDALDAIIGAWIGARGADEVVDACRSAGVSAAVCDGLLEVGRNEHFRQRGDLVEVRHGDTTLTLAAPLPPGVIRWLGRTLGQDNDAVLRVELGADLEALRLAGVV